jgi:FkbM family methyltransferase
MDDFLNPISTGPRSEKTEVPTPDVIEIPKKFTAEYLRHFRFKAKTLIDIGVQRGTPELYNLFGDRKVVLVDPLPGVAKDIEERYLGRLDYQFHPVALGAEPGVATLNIMGTARGKTGITPRAAMTESTITEQHQVKVVTLDSLLLNNPTPAPYGLKIDTEGYELNVLKGAEKTLESTEFIIAEVSIKKRFVDSYRFSEIVSFLGARNFELIDILNFRPRTQKFYDCLFMRYDHPIFG